MSLDNVLAVAGAACDHPGILIIGLVLSVALMGLAANILAKYIARYRWIAYVGLFVILYVAGKMLYDGLIDPQVRTDVHRSVVQSLMWITYALFCLIHQNKN